MAPETVQYSKRAGSGLDGTVDLARDRELVERCQGGDRTAFEEFYHRYHRRLFHFCLRRLHEPYESEDAVQEAFTKAWRALPTFAGERRFYPWLTVIAGNVCTDILRRRSRLVPVENVPLPLINPDERDVDELILREVDVAMVTQALGNLSDRHQRVLQLREGSGWSTRQIAEHEGVAVPAMETLLWRARQALKREFAALAETGGRLGVILGLGGAALRRLAFRTASRVPVLQSSPIRGPGTLVASLVLAGGVVAGGVAVGTHHPASPAAVTMPPAAQAGALQPAHTSVQSSPAGAGAGGPSTVATVAGPVQAATPGTTPSGVGSSPAAETTAAAPGPAVGTESLPAGGGTAASQLGTAATGTAGSAVSGLVDRVGSAVTGAVGGAGSTVTTVVTSLDSTLNGVISGLGGALNGLSGGSTTTTGGSLGSLLGPP